MIHLLIPKLTLKPLGKKVSRIVMVHPNSVQFVQHDPTFSQLCIRYMSGEEMVHGKSRGDQEDV
jgi:hypothetical protein